jgi:hypothetical protein
MELLDPVLASSHSGVGDVDPALLWGGMLYALVVQTSCILRLIVESL